MAGCSDGTGRTEVRGVSRRGFIESVLLIASSTAMMTTSAGAAALRMATPLQARSGVVAFHSDQLYLDRSGTVEPYIPPVGLRSLDGLDEEALSRLVYSL